MLDSAAEITLEDLHGIIDDLADLRVHGRIAQVGAVATRIPAISPSAAARQSKPAAGRLSLSRSSGPAMIRRTGCANGAAGAGSKKVCRARDSRAAPSVVSFALERTACTGCCPVTAAVAP
jgi:hypothetical protein